VASEELGNSLRDEIDGFVRARLNDVHDQIARLQDEVNEAFRRLREQRPDEGSVVDPAIADKISDHIRSAHESGVEQGASASKSEQMASGIAVLKAAIDDIDDQRSQAEILNMLVNRSASFAPRVAFFVVKSERIIGWRARGLEGTVGDEAIREVSLPITSETSLSEAVRSRATLSADANTYTDDGSFLQRLGGDTPARIVAIPLVVRGKSVAVLYADSNGLDSGAVNVEALETLVRVAGMAVELLAVSRATPASRMAPGSRMDKADAVQAPEPEPAPRVEETQQYPQPEAEPTPEPQYEQQYQPEYQPQSEPSFQTEYHPPQAEQDYAPAQQPEPEPEQLQAAAQPEVAAPTEQAEPAGAGGQFGAPLGTKRRYGSNDADLPVDVSDEERRLHNDARRFARLLVSEIKLYNEQKVREGRMENDIYERLREDIDRSREMYDKRVAPPVAARYDYFHQEIVNTLAEGDPSKLGGSYPGAAA
jgi:hypothetical protein